MGIRRGLTWKFVSMAVVILAVTIGFGMSIIVLQQRNFPYEQKLQEMRAIVGQMTSQLTYFNSIQDDLNRAGMNRPLKETVPMVATLYIADVYRNTAES